MTTAAVDVLGFLPGPVSKNNAGAADLLAGELFAYAVSSGVAVVDVSRELFAHLLPMSLLVLQAPPYDPAACLFRYIVCSSPVSCTVVTKAHLQPQSAGKPPPPALKDPISCCCSCKLMLLRYSLELAVSQPVWVSSAGRQSAFQETQLHLS